MTCLWKLVLLPALAAASCTDESCPSQAAKLIQRKSGVRKLHRAMKQKSGVVFKNGKKVKTTSLLSASDFKSRVETSFAEAKQVRQRSLLAIEQDFKLLDGSVFRAYQSEMNCTQNGMEAFTHFVNVTGLTEELSEAELLNFGSRFAEMMAYYCKHHVIDGLVDPMKQHEVFHVDLMQALEKETPVLSDKLFEILSESSSYTLTQYPWLANFSRHDILHKTGMQQPEGHNKTVLLQTQDVTSNIKARSLPESFSPEEEWPECASTINRIHNQGTCGSCWAFGAISALDSRLCIATGGVFSGDGAMLSRGYTT